MVDYKLMGSRLKRYRKNAGMTQEHLAEAAEITSVYLSKIENGKVHPTLDTLAQLCACIGCNLEELFSDVSTESCRYQSEQVVKLFHACTPAVKPIALDLLKQLSKL